MANDPVNIPLSSSNIVGIIQRALVELHAYMSQNADQIDPNLCMTKLEEAAMWVQRLPNGRLVPQGESDERPDQRPGARAN